MAKAIPKSALYRARRRTCRHVCAALMQVMADGDASFEVIDKRRGVKPGSTKRTLDILAAGKSVRLDLIGEIAWAAGGAALNFRAVPIPRQA